MNWKLNVFHIPIFYVLLINCVHSVLPANSTEKFGGTLKIKRQVEEKSPVDLTSRSSRNSSQIVNAPEQKISDLDFRHFLQKPINPFPSSHNPDTNGNERFQFLPPIFQDHHEDTTKMPIPEKKKFRDVKDEYTKINGHGYYKTIKRPMRNWKDARDICSSEESHLVIINSKEEAMILNNFYFEDGIKPDTSWHKFLVGLQKDDSEQFKTVLGEPAQSTGFHEWVDRKIERDSIDRNCAIYDIDKEKLDTWPCSWPNTFICEHEL